MHIQMHNFQLWRNTLEQLELHDWNTACQSGQRQTCRFIPADCEAATTSWLRVEISTPSQLSEGHELCGHRACDQHVVVDTTERMERERL